MGQRDGVTSLTCWFIPQMATTARAEPCQIREPGASAGSPTRMVGTQALGPRSTAFPRSLLGSEGQETESNMEHLGHKPAVI